MVLQGLEHGTARLMGVGTVGEAAVLGEAEDLTEIARQLFRLHVESAEALDARSVNQPSAFEGDHLRKGGGVLSHLMGIRDLGRTEVHAWHEAVDECRLPHPAIATEQ